MAKAGGAGAGARGAHALTVPFDASGVEGFTPEQRLKAIVVGEAGVLASETFALDKAGRAQLTFALANKPGTVRVIVGPEAASDDELTGLQTLAVDVPSRSWGGRAELAIQPIVIAPYYWWWWLRWCRTFTIRGRVVCPNGNPVPGAKVCAYDVDRWWWWCSEDQVGCATTDVNGAFEITFRWCCGWWPWWWWARRTWHVDTSLAERIQESLRAVPDLPRPPVPGPRPDPRVFDALLATDGIATKATSRDVEPGALESLRTKLLERLPRVPDLEALHIWPWWPWRPWTDCTPDIIFKVTQDCGHGDQVVVDENCGDARWNIPTTLNVTLVADDEACCIPPRHPGCGDEECFVFTKACDDLVTEIGGNLGAPASPAGYRSPGVVATAADRPYAGSIPIHGVCGEWVDYHEFEYSADGGATWNPLPPNSTGGFTLRYFDIAGPPWFVPVTFNFGTVDGRWVIESLAHWESVNGPRVWVDDPTTLIVWLTTMASSPTGPTALFPDGTYRLRVRAWDESGGQLVNGRYPGTCGEEEENRIVLTLDNRMVGPGAGHPTTPDHPCGGGTVHLCTTEPDTDFIAVRIDGVPVGPCSIVDRAEASMLEIDFLAHDPDGHLAYYSLSALWGENNAQSLLGLPSATITRLSAAQAGPTYAAARAGATPENTPAAAAPAWEGGTMRLRVAVNEAFPEPCCYLLDLWAYKRTIDSCNDDFTHRNRSTFTFTVA